MITEVFFTLLQESWQNYSLEQEKVRTAGSGNPGETTVTSKLRSPWVIVGLKYRTEFSESIQLGRSGLWWQRAGRKQKGSFRWTCVALISSDKGSLRGSFLSSVQLLIPAFTWHSSVHSHWGHTLKQTYTVSMLDVNSDHFANIYQLQGGKNPQKNSKQKIHQHFLLLSVIFDPYLLKIFCCQGVKRIICTPLLFESLILKSMEWIPLCTETLSEQTKTERDLHLPRGAQKFAELLSWSQQSAWKTLLWFYASKAPLFQIETKIKYNINKCLKIPVQHTIHVRKEPMSLSLLDF